MYSSMRAVYLSQDICIKRYIHSKGAVIRHKSVFQLHCVHLSAPCSTCMRQRARGAVQSQNLQSNTLYSSTVVPRTTNTFHLLSVVSDIVTTFLFAAQRSLLCRAEPTGCSSRSIVCCAIILYMEYLCRDGARVPTHCCTYVSLCWSD